MPGKAECLVNLRNKETKMYSLNRVSIIGNVGKVEIKTLNNGQKIANLSVATSERWKDKTTGEDREITDWHRVVVFNQAIAGVIESYVQKGTKLYVEGALKTRKYQNMQGTEIYVTEIVLNPFNGNIIILDRKKDQESVAQEPVEESGITNGQAIDEVMAQIGNTDDIPF